MESLFQYIYLFKGYKPKLQFFSLDEDDNSIYDE